MTPEEIQALTARLTGEATVTDTSNSPSTPEWHDPAANDPTEGSSTPAAPPAAGAESTNPTPPSSSPSLLSPSPTSSSSSTGSSTGSSSPSKAPAKEDLFPDGRIVCMGGSEGPIAEAVQARLDTHGYDTGAAGIFGPVDVDSLARFQDEHDLPVTGYLDERTWDALAGEPKRSE